MRLWMGFGWLEIESVLGLTLGFGPEELASWNIHGVD